MIDVRELRIGSKLLINGKVITVLGIINTKIYYGNIESPCYNYLSDFEPIPLTAERLLKCGFERNDNHNPNFNTYNFNFSQIMFSNYGNKEITFNYGLTLVIKIEYLHQLQNLYHDIEQEELNFNL